MKKSIQVISIILFCVYLIAVGVLCFMEPDNLPDVPMELFGIPMDKIAHFTMFIPFPILAWFSISREGWNKSRKAICLILILAAGCLMALTTELLQGTTDYRSCDINDFYADLFGMSLCWIGVVTGAFIQKKHKKHKEDKCSRN